MQGAFPPELQYRADTAPSRHCGRSAQIAALRNDLMTSPGHKETESALFAKLLTKGRYVSISVLALKWSVSNSTIRRMIEDGSLKALKVGKSFRIHVLELERYEQHNQST